MTLKFTQQRTHLLIATAFLHLACSAALAQKSTKTVGELLKRADRGAEFRLTEKQQSLIPGSEMSLGSTKNSAVNLNLVKPPKSQSFYSKATGDEAELERITDQQIAELFKLTKRFKDSPQRGELWLRLAELYVEKAQIIDLRVQNEYDVKLADFQSGASKVRPVLDLKAARDYNRRAIQLYEWFVRDFPNDSKVDQALFFLGYNHFEIGNLEKGYEYYSRLTKTFPKSSYVIESHFALGEFSFDKEDFKKALESYREVLKYRKHRLFTFALYKSAWCEFRTGNYERAFQTLELLVKTNKAAEASEASSGKKINTSRLESESTRDLVLFYAEARPANKAVAYFRGLSPATASDQLEKLAYYYAERKGDYAAANEIFSELIRANPTSAKAFDYQYQIVKTASSSKQSKEFRQQMFSWVVGYGENSAWMKANAKNKELLDNSFKLRESTLRNHTLQQHQTAQNSRAVFSQKLATEGYDLYLKEFKSAPAYADMNFYYGELLYDMGQFEKAGLQYRWVIENAPGSKFYNKAAENVLVAYDKTIPTDAQIEQRVGKSTDRFEFTPATLQFVSISNWYVKKFPTSPKISDIRFRIGRLHYQHNQFTEAVPIFKGIVAEFPNTKNAEYSANLLLDSYNILKDYEGLEREGKALLAQSGVAGTKAGQEISQVLESASFKGAQDLEVKKDYAQSAKLFEAFAQQNPNSKLASMAVFNAAINYERAGQKSNALRLHQQVLSSTDKSLEVQRPQSARIIAKNQLESGQLELAAASFSLAGDLTSTKAEKADMYYNAAVLYSVLNQDQAALRRFDQAMSEGLRGSEKQTALIQKGKIHSNLGQLTLSVNSLTEAVGGSTSTEPEVLEALDLLAKDLRRLKRVTEAEKVEARLLSLSSRAGARGAPYLAKVKFAQANELYIAMKAIKIPSAAEAQQKAVKNKIDAMTNLNKALLGVVNLNSGPEIVDSLYLTGEANEHMYSSIQKAPIPKGLTPDETAEYKTQLDLIAAPYLKAAGDSYAAAVRRAQDLDVFNESGKKSYRRVLELRPDAYAQPLQKAEDVKFASWMGL